MLCITYMAIFLIQKSSIVMTVKIEQKHYIKVYQKLGNTKRETIQKIQQRSVMRLGLMITIYKQNAYLPK